MLDKINKNVFKLLKVKIYNWRNFDKSKSFSNHIKFFFERIKFLFTGKLYHIQACPNQPMQAVALDFEAPFEKVKK